MALLVGLAPAIGAIAGDDTLHITSAWDKYFLIADIVFAMP
jgi:hypothetical protein